jgi:hypothetical protein
MDAFLDGLTVDISQKCQQGRCDLSLDAIEESPSNNFIFACHDLFAYLSLLFNDDK